MRKTKHVTVDLKGGERADSAASSWKKAMVSNRPKPLVGYTLGSQPAAAPKRTYAGPTPRTPIQAVPAVPTEQPAHTHATESPSQPDATDRHKTPVVPYVAVAEVRSRPRAAAPRRRPGRRRRIRPLRGMRRLWARIVSPFALSWLADLDVMLWIVGAVVAVAAVTPYLMRVVPHGIRATQTADRISRGYGELFDAEEEALQRDGAYIDPARFARDHGIDLLLDPQYEVLVSAADDNHWILKLRSRRAGTVCTALSMTYLTRRGGGFTKECRPIDARDSAAVAIPRSP